MEEKSKANAINSDYCTHLNAYKYIYALKMMHAYDKREFEKRRN